MYFILFSKALTSKCLLRNVRKFYSKAYSTHSHEPTKLNNLFKCTRDVDRQIYLFHRQTNSVHFAARPFNCSVRHFCTENTRSNKLPALMVFPELVWPSVFKSLRNFMLATLIIKPYFDNEFTLHSFVAGSKQAVEVVSKNLAEGDTQALSGLVTSDALTQIQSSLSNMSLHQMQQISVLKDDIYFSFPYQIGVMFNEQEGGIQKRFVEITMVYHALRGLQAMRTRGEEPPLNMGMIPSFRENISILNYRFIREFTKGVEDSWTINMLNHFKPNDLIEDK